MNTDVVHEYNVAFLEGRSKDLLNIGREHLARHWPFEHEGGGDTIMAQRGREGDGFPVSMRYLCDQSLPHRGSPVETSDRGRDRGFIDENQPLHVKPRLLLLQRLTCGCDVRSILLGGPQAFF